MAILIPKWNIQFRRLQCTKLISRYNKFRNNETYFFRKFLAYKDFNVAKRIICTSYCRVGNQTVIAIGM